MKAGFVILVAEGPECHHADRRRNILPEPVKEYVRAVREQARDRYEERTRNADASDEHVCETSNGDSRAEAVSRTAVRANQEVDIRQRAQTRPSEGFPPPSSVPGSVGSPHHEPAGSNASQCVSDRRRHSAYTKYRKMRNASLPDAVEEPAILRTGGRKCLEPVTN